MRMTTDLALDETNSGFDPSSQMHLYGDVAGFAVNAPMIAPPGKRWAYSSATTQLLARIIRDAVGGPEQTLAFAWRELFNPLGMRNVTLEFDASGTLQGLSNMLASARDWARFGLLYLNDGMAGENAYFTRTGWTFQPPLRSTLITAPDSGPIAVNTRMPGGACGWVFRAMRSSPSVFSASAS
jgi:CubicO group peptidase (beta-lactamase class C family)